MFSSIHSNIRQRAVASLRELTRSAVLRRFIKQQDGSSAVEFSLVALPFLGLLFAIIETAMVFFAGQTMEAAAADSSRLIMTGQGEKYTASDFKNQVCARIYGLFDCAGGMYVDVKAYSSFTAIDTTPPVSNKTFNTTMSYPSKINVGDIVVVSLYYQWPIYVTLLNNNLDNLTGGNRLLTAKAVFRVEPYK